VEPRYQHRVLFWGVLGALVLRGLMIALGAALISRFEWILYVLGAFLMIAAVRMFIHKDKAPHPERSRVFRWVQKIFPVARDYNGQSLFIHEAGRLVATPLLLVLLLIEGVDVAFALDSIPAVFGITRDPFIVFSSNVCAILGLRAFYFLLAGVLPYFRYLDEGLSIVLLFVGAKMLAAPWIQLPTALALLIIAIILGASLILSVWAAKWERLAKMKMQNGADAEIYRGGRRTNVPETISDLAGHDPIAIPGAAALLFGVGRGLGNMAVQPWLTDSEFSKVLVHEIAQVENPETTDMDKLRATVGIAVFPNKFDRIRKAAGYPPLAVVPPDQDAIEFELHLIPDVGPDIRLDILTTKQVGGEGAIAKFLAKFGEGIQQVEYEVTDVDRATKILADRFGVKAIYPATRPGADGTRVNFFLVPSEAGKKILIELVEPARRP